MALSPMGQDVVSKGGKAAKDLVEKLYPLLKELNVLYDSNGGLKSTIQQSDLDGVASYSGITKGQLDDGFYVLTATLKTDIENGYSQLAELAAHAGN